MPDQPDPNRLLLSMNELTTFRWSIDEDLHHYRAAGFTGVGVWRRKLSDFGVERGVELLADSGLEVSNLMWAGGFTGNDGRSLEESVADAARAVELAERVAARCLVLHTGGRNFHTHRHADRLLRSALEDLLPIAEARGVTLAVEPMHPACADDWTLLTSLESAAALLDEYRSDALRMVFDTYHFAGAPLDEIANLAPRCAVVHLADRAGPPTGDQQRRELGAGELSLEGVVRALLAGGFDGYFDVELIGSDVAPNGYGDLVRRSAEHARGLLAAAMDLVPAHA